MNEQTDNVGTASDDVFWQNVADFAYMLDFEPADFRREKLEALLAHFPEPNPRASLEEFRRYAVHELLRVWAQEHGIGPHRALAAGEIDDYAIPF